MADGSNLLQERVNDFGGYPVELRKILWKKVEKAAFSLSNPFWECRNCIQNRANGGASGSVF
jgi:hypothetical protein